MHEEDAVGLWPHRIEQAQRQLRKPQEEARLCERLRATEQCKCKAVTDTPRQRRRIEVRDQIMVDIDQKQDRAVARERDGAPHLPARRELAILGKDARLQIHRPDADADHEDRNEVGHA